MTRLTVEGFLTQPYISVAEFRAAPTWLDSDDLIPGGVSTAQDSELYNVLLRASTWADGFIDQRFGAHVVTEQTRARADRYGRIFLHPSNFPVRSVTAVAYGVDFQNMTELSQSGQFWVEDEEGICIALYPNSGTFMGSLQFGSVASGGTEMFVQYQYIAGYASTTLSTAATAGQTAITVNDPTGLLAPSTVLTGTLRGSTARLWDPGVEEAASVATGYVAGNSTVPLTSALANNHAVGTLVSELPAEVHQAIICYAVGLLMREDVTAEEPFGRTPYGPTTRKASRDSSRAGGLISEAEKCLSRYKRRR